MYCIYCGANISENSKFCQKCGQKTLITAADKTQGQSTSPNSSPHINQISTSQSVNNQPLPKNSQHQTPKKKKKKGCFVALSFFALFIIAILSILYMIGSKMDSPEDKLQNDLIALTDTYYDAQIMTYKVLHTSNQEVDYELWLKGMEKVCQLWEEVEVQSKTLDTSCDKVIASASKNSRLDKRIFTENIFRTPTAYAYTQQEINAVFDAAPAGQRLKTLANFLGTDAKTAYNVLKNTQAEITKEAYKQEDFYRKCETTATIIKDTAKVGFFAGSLVLSGGTTASFGLLESACVVAGGVDLVLELYEDGATIAYGSDDDVTMVIKDMRKGSKPIAMILGLSNLAGNAIEQLGYLSDSTLALFQSDEVLGFNIKGSKEISKIQVASMPSEEVKEWTKDQDIDTKITPMKDTDLKLSMEDVKDIKIDIKEIPKESPESKEQSSNVDEKPQTSEQESGIIGDWILVGYEYTAEQQAFVDSLNTENVNLIDDRIDYGFDKEGNVLFYYNDVNGNSTSLIMGTYTFDGKSGMVDLDAEAWMKLELLDNGQLRMDDHKGGIIYAEKAD